MRRFIVNDEGIRSNAMQFLSDASIEEPIEVTIKPYKPNRTLAQNRLFHMWMSEVSKSYAESTGEFHRPEVWKEYFKKLFLGEKSEEVNGEVVTFTCHTSDLKTKPFAEFLDQVDHYCGSELGVVLPYPQDLYYEAIGR